MKKLSLSHILFFILLPTLCAQNIIPHLDTKKGLWGYLNPQTGKWKVKPRFDSVQQFTLHPNGQMQAQVAANGKFGYIDQQGKTLGAGIIFESVKPMNGNAIMVTVKGKTGIADYDAQWIVKPEADATIDIGPEGWIFVIKGKQGLITPDATWLINPIYDNIDVYHPDYFIIKKENKTGILLRTGDIALLPDEFTDMRPDGELWRVAKGDKYGLYDLKSKKIIVKPEYADIGTPLHVLGNQYIPVQKHNGKWGITDQNGNTILKHKYLTARSVPGTGILLSDKSNAYMWDLNTHSLTAAGSTAEKIEGSFKILTASINDSSYTTVTSLNGMTLGSDIFSLPDYYVITGNTQSFIFTTLGKLIAEFPADKTAGTPMQINKWIVFPQHAVSPSFNIHTAKTIHPLVIVKNNDGTNTILSTIPTFTNLPITDAAAYGNDSTYINVKNKNGLWSLFTTNGQQIYDFKSPYPASEFHYPGLHIITNNNNELGLIDNSGNIRMEPQAAEFITDKNNKNMLFCLNGKHQGAFNLQNHQLTIPLSRKYINLTSNDFKGRVDGATLQAVKTSEGKWGMVDNLYNELIPPVYDSIQMTPYFFITHLGNIQTYHHGNLQPFTPTPDTQATFSTQIGADKTIIASFDVEFQFQPMGKSYTIMAQLLDNNNVPYGPERTEYIEIHKPINKTKGYFTIPLPAGSPNQRFHLQFSIIDQNTNQILDLQTKSKFDISTQ